MELSLRETIPSQPDLGNVMWETQISNMEKTM